MDVVGGAVASTRLPAVVVKGNAAVVVTLVEGEVVVLRASTHKLVTSTLEGVRTVPGIKGSETNPKPGVVATRDSVVVVVVVVVVAAAAAAVVVVPAKKFAAVDTAAIGLRKKLLGTCLKKAMMGLRDGEGNAGKENIHSTRCRIRYKWASFHLSSVLCTLLAKETRVLGT